MHVLLELSDYITRCIRIGLAYPFYLPVLGGVKKNLHEILLLLTDALL